MMDSSSRSILQKQLVLAFEEKRFDECAACFHKVEDEDLIESIKLIPLNKAINNIPSTFSLLEAIYCRMLVTNIDSLPPVELFSEKILSSMVKWLASFASPLSSNKEPALDYYIPMCKNIVHVVVAINPKSRLQLQNRQDKLRTCIDSLNNHGLVPAVDNPANMIELNEAIRHQLQKNVSQLKTALQKLESSSAPHSTPLINLEGSTMNYTSQQHLMKANRTDIQDRLIRNKTLLNAVEPVMRNSLLSKLLDSLSSRIETDKTVLSVIVELKNELGEIPAEVPISLALNQIADSCQRIEQIMPQNEPKRQVNVCQEYLPDSEPDVESQDNIYETVDDEALYDTNREEKNIMNVSQHTHHDGNKLASQVNKLVLDLQSLDLQTHQHLPPCNEEQGQAGSGPFPPNARTNGVRHSLVSSSQISLSSVSSIDEHPISSSLNNLHCKNSTVKNNQTNNNDSGTKGEVDILRRQVRHLRQELSRCKDVIAQMTDREKSLKDRLSEQAQKQLQQSSRFEDLNLGESRPSQLVRRYTNMYSQSRLDAFDALDDLPEMAEFDDLKGKLLFSIIVLSYRSTQQRLTIVRNKLNQLLGLSCDDEPDRLAREINDSIQIFLRKSVDRYDLHHCVQEVCNQVWATLYDYPSLKECTPLQEFIEECVRLSWSLCNQNPPLVIDFDGRNFNDDLHQRFHTSDSDNSAIKSILWPALREGSNGVILQKAVVVT